MYEMIDIESDDFKQIITNFYNKCKKDRLQHDQDCMNKTTAQKIEIHEKFYQKQKRYANDLFNDLTV